MPVSGVYVAISLTHVVGCCLGTTVLARLQSVYVALNVLYVSWPILLSTDSAVHHSDVTIR